MYAVYALSTKALNRVFEGARLIGYGLVPVVLLAFLLTGIPCAQGQSERGRRGVPASEYVKEPTPTAGWSELTERMVQTSSKVKLKERLAQVRWTKRPIDYVPDWVLAANANEEANTLKQGKEVGAKREAESNSVAGASYSSTRRSDGIQDIMLKQGQRRSAGSVYRATNTRYAGSILSTGSILEPRGSSDGTTIFSSKYASKAGAEGGSLPKNYSSIFGE
jgi:hypothetical protein